MSPIRCLGRLEVGFARLRCRSCGKNLLISFSCKRKGICPSCQKKRQALFAEQLIENILSPVPHLHGVISIPKRLRPFFLYKRNLLLELARCAYQAVTPALQEATGEPKAVPGASVAIHTAGSLLNPHPHIHALFSWGLFLNDGTFRPSAPIPEWVIETRFQNLLLKRLAELAIIPVDVPDQMRSWARLLEKHFPIEIGRCPRCEARLSVIAVIQDEPVIWRLLKHLKLLPSRHRPLRKRSPPSSASTSC